MVDDIDFSEELYRATEAELIEKARRDILAFTIYNKPDYDVNWHHRVIADALNKFVDGDPEYQNLMIFTAPRHGKSELVSRNLPAYIHGKYPDDEIMSVSYLDSLAGDMTVDVQKIIDSKSYQKVFPGTKILPPGMSYAKGVRNSSEHTIIGRKGKYRGQGVGGSFTGKGTNWINIDDPIKGREIADSETFRERLWNFFNNDLLTRLETKLDTGRKGRILVTQTRWHEDDLSGRLMDHMNKNPMALQFKIINLPAIKIDNSNPDDIREIGDALWPKKYDLKQLATIKSSIGARAWSSLYQQDPVPDGGNLFTDSMFKYADVPDNLDWRFVTADTAYKEKEENDSTVFSSWGVIKDQLFLLDVWSKQCKSTEVEKPGEIFIRRQMKYGYRGTWIEPKGHGIYLNQLWATKGMMIPGEKKMKEFYSDRRFDKLERANNVVPHISNRHVVINKNIPIKEELVAQCLGFPKRKHDDFVDTLVDALKIVYGKKVSILDVL